MVGNLTFQTAVDYISKSKIVIDRKNIFIALGSNQIYSATKDNVNKWVNRLINTIDCLNSNCKIYFVPVLPRPIDNQQVKPYIIAVNKMIHACVKKCAKQHVQFLSIQNFFVKNGVPDPRLYENDKVSLNTDGCTKLRTLVFEAVGFKKN